MSDNETTRVEAMNPVKLASVADHIQADMMEALLVDSGISVYRKSLKSGGAMQAFMGFTIFGEELYVDQADYERAARLMEVFENTPMEDEENKSGEEYEEDNEDDENVDENDNAIPQKIFRAIIIFLIIGSLLGFIRFW